MTKYDNLDNNNPEPTGAPAHSPTGAPTDAQLGQQLSAYADWLVSRSDAGGGSLADSGPSGASDFASGAATPFTIAANESGTKWVDSDLPHGGHRSAALADDDGVSVDSSALTGDDDALAEVHEISFAPATAAATPSTAGRFLAGVAACLALVVLGLGGFFAFENLRSDDDATEVVADDGLSAASSVEESSAGTLGGDGDAQDDQGSDGSEGADESTASGFGTAETADTIQEDSPEAAAAAAEAALEAVDATSRPALSPPQAFVTSIVADGDRFVGVEQQFDPSSGLARTSLVTSADGNDWTPIEGSAFPADFSAHQLIGGDGQWFAVGTVGTFENGEPMFGPPDSSVYASTDLRSWSRIEIPELSAELPEGLVSNVYISGGAASGNGIALVAMTSVEPDFQALNIDMESFCGVENTDSAVILRSCSGAELHRLEVDADSSSLLNGPGNSTFLFSADGQSFTTLDLPEGTAWVHDVFAADDGFIVFDTERNLMHRTDGVDGWTTEAMDLGDSGTRGGLGSVAGSDETMIAVSYGSRGSTIVASSDGGATWDDVDLSGLVSLGENETFNVSNVSHGPAGFALTGEVFDESTMGPQPQPFTLQLDGYIAEFDGYGDKFILRSDDGTFEESYFRYGGVEGSNTIQGPFGTLFLMDPESGERLVSISQREIYGAEAASMGLPIPPDFPETTFSVERDGYVISGSPDAGPITIVRPDGTETTYEDEWLLVNGDVSDGIEATDLNSYLVPSFVFYENDEELVRITLDDVYQSAPNGVPQAIPAPVTDFDEGPNVPFSLEDGTFGFEGEFPVGELRLVDLETGEVLNTWFADDDFEPAEYDDIRVGPNDQFFTFLPSAEAEEGFELDIEEIWNLAVESGLESGPYPGEDAVAVEELAVPQAVPFPPNMRSIVLWSPDASSWEILQDTTGFPGRAVVGDDEVLVERFNENGPAYERFAIN